MAKVLSIFKYREFNKSSIELFINKELWFAKPNSLNDPFECQMVFPEFLESIWRHHPISSGEQEKIKDLLEQKLKEVGICSLSRTRQNQLMWAHYADEHKGFCVGFNETRLKKTTPEFFLQDIEYQSELPYKGIIERIKYFASISGANNSSSIVGDILSSVIGIKFTNWKYEKEVRLIRSKAGAVKFEAKSVTSIALGLRMDERDKKTLRTLLSGSEWDHLLWFQAEKAQDKFGLVFKRI